MAIAVGNFGPSNSTGGTRFSEMIGRTATDSALLRFRNLYPSSVTVDWTQSDYAWWSKLRRGKQAGYDLGALFAKPIGAIMSDWTLGGGVQAQTGDDDVDAALADFLTSILDLLLVWDYDSVTLGDSYLAVSPDGTVDILSPDVVKVHTNPLNAREVWGYTITTKPDDAITITDEYFVQPRAYRKVTVRRGANVEQEREFPLLIDELPIIALHNEREANEVYGHPAFEALRRLFAEYDDIISKSLDGVKLMGHPIPVIEGAEDPEAERDNNKTSEETITLPDGSTATVPVVDMALLSMLFFGKGVTFKFASPGAFTQDAGRMLEYLFLLMLQHSRIPEWVWGGAVNSSKASVDAQAPAFERFIEGRRRNISKPITALLRVWLKYRALTDRTVRALPVTLTWPEVLPRNEETAQRWVDMGLRYGWMTRETAARLSGVVDDPAGEIAAVDAEAAAAAATSENAIQAEIDRLADDRTPDEDESEA